MLSPTKKILILILVVCVLLANTATAAADALTLTIVGPDGTETYTSGSYAYTISITKGGSYTLTSSNPLSEAMFSININAPEEHVVLTLNGVSLHAKSSSYPGRSAIRCYKAASVTICSAEGTENILRGSQAGSGIDILSTCGDVILSGSGTITAYGSSGGTTGAYNMSDHYAPGIYKADSENWLIFESGTIEAHGTRMAPGIGGGYTYSPGSYGGASSSSASSTSHIMFRGGKVSSFAFKNYIPNQFFTKGIGGGYGANSSSNLVVSPSQGTTIEIVCSTVKSIYETDQKRSLWSETFSENTTTDITSNIAGPFFELTSTVAAPSTPTYTISATADPAEGGTVTGAGNYDHGATVTLTAAANEGYAFAGWYEGTNKVGDEATLSFTASAARTLTAKFAQNTYTISAVADPTVGGTVTGAGDYAHGATVTLTAAANEGYAFAGWYENGQQRATSETLSFEAERSRAFIALFNVISKEPVILKHPQDVSIFVGEKAAFYVEAQGTDDLKYFWQINRNDGNGFVDTACITKELQLENVPLHYDGYEFRCIVEDSNQKRVVSNAAKLNVRMPIESAPDVPKTGDATPLMATMVLLMLSVWGICVIYINYRKQYR